MAIAIIVGLAIAFEIWIVVTSYGWADAILGTMVVAIVGVGALLVAIAAPEMIREHDQFMADCQQDHKQYECLAMWRAGERESAMVQPIIVPVAY